MSNYISRENNLFLVARCLRNKRYDASNSGIYHLFHTFASYFQGTMRMILLNEMKISYGKKLILAGIAFSSHPDESDCKFLPPIQNQPSEWCLVYLIPIYCKTYRKKIWLFPIRKLLNTAMEFSQIEYDCAIRHRRCSSSCAYIPSICWWNFSLNLSSISIIHSSLQSNKSRQRFFELK